MKRNIKKVISLVLVLAMSLAISVPAFAIKVNPKSKNPNWTAQIEQVEVYHKDLSIRNALPEEIDPNNAIYVSSIEEYERILNELSSLKENQSITTEVRMNNRTSLMSSQSSLSDVAQTPISGIPLPPVYMNCQFSYTSQYHDTYGYIFTSIFNIQSWLTGIQVPVGYTYEQKNASYSYYDHQTEASTKVNGVLSTYLVMPNGFKIVDQNVSYTFNWLARN